MGKIAPEIKPGEYDYTDKDKYPGLKELMIPYHYEQFKPGAPPFPANFRKKKIIPTRQYYFWPAYAQLSMKNMGKTKQDNQGYWLWNTYEGGFPFARPEGPHKAMQIMYNQQFKPHQLEGGYTINYARGITKDFREDYAQEAWGSQMMTHGRTLPPALPPAAGPAGRGSGP